MDPARSSLRPRTRRASGYLVAVLAVSVTTLLREKLRPLLTDHSVFAMDYLAIAFAAWYGGFGPGVAAILTAVPFAMLVIPPAGLAVVGTANLVALLLFVAISTLVVLLIESVRRARERAVEAHGRTAAALEELRESQEKYRGLFERNLAGVSRTSLDGRILDGNRALARIYGYDRPSEMLTVRAETLHENAEARRAFVERLRDAGGALVNIEAVGRRRDGSPVWTLESHQIVEERGRVVIEGSILDISDRKQIELERESLVDALELERNRLEAIIRQMPAGLVIADAEGKVILGNEQFERILGTKFSPNRMVGESDGYRAFHPDGRPFSPGESALAIALATGKDVRDVEVVIERQDGRRKVIVASASPLRDSAGRIVGSVATFFEVTEQRELAGELARTVAELKEGDRRKDEFIAMLAHELRNPLVPIANAVRVLQLPEVGRGTLRESLSMIERQLGHMVRLVDDLLDVSRISRGKVEIRKDRFDLSAMAAEVVEDFRGEIGRHGLSLETVFPKESIWVDGDRVRLAEVLTNLVQNAIKFTDSGGTIRVTLARDGDRALLSVRDSGIGIDPAMLPRIFEPFSQADRSIARTRGGLGLGLALVRGLVTAHGGEARAASDGIGRGTEVSVLLPTAERRVPEAREKGEARKPAPPRRVVVVEDNVPVADGMRFLLEHLSHEVRVAADGVAGLAAIRAFRPDVVLCDIGLPGEMDGYALAREVRADPAISATCLIAITGYGQSADRERAQQAGFDLHLTKPVQPTRLEELLHGLPRSARGTPRRA
jgi:PAS domain S-box-containing protein